MCFFDSVSCVPFLVLSSINLINSLIGLSVQRFLINALTDTDRRLLIPKQSVSPVIAKFSLRFNSGLSVNENCFLNITTIFQTDHPEQSRRMLYLSYLDTSTSSVWTALKMLFYLKDQPVAESLQLLEIIKLNRLTVLEIRQNQPYVVKINPIQGA